VVTTPRPMRASRFKVAIWWCFPCQATAAIFKHLADDPEFEVSVFLLDGMSEARAKLGWKVPNYGRAEVISLAGSPNTSEASQFDFPLTRFDAHIFNSAYAWPRFNKIIDSLIPLGVPFGVMTEAPFNGFSGVLRTLKNIYINRALRFRVKKRAQQAHFVLSLSGEALDARHNFCAMGFPPHAIYDFGYFPPAPQYVRLAPKPPDTPLNLLCTGYLTENKGQHLLIAALARVRELSDAPFMCYITGFGKAQRHLQRLIEQRELQNCVTLTGSLPTSDLMALYERTDLFVAPAIEEPWGVRINEAIHVGLPILMSDRIGAVQIMRSSGGGRAFVSNSIDSLVDELIHFFSNPTDLLQMQEALIQYRPRIQPSAASEYLKTVLRRHLREDGALPVPTWK
jgi:glycosyltransferase involved in cell wall biosynthesis